MFLGFLSLILAVINLFPFLPLDGGHVLWSVAEKVRGTADLAGGDVPLQLGRGSCCSRSSCINGVSNDISRLSG